MKYVGEVWGGEEGARRETKPWRCRSSGVAARTEPLALDLSKGQKTRGEASTGDDPWCQWESEPWRGCNPGVGRHAD